MNTYKVYAPNHLDKPREVIKAEDSFKARLQYAVTHELHVFDVIAIRANF